MKFVRLGLSKSSADQGGIGGRVTRGVIGVHGVVTGVDVQNHGLITSGFHANHIIPVADHIIHGLGKAGTLQIGNHLVEVGTL